MINPQPSPSEITVFAPAKINMILRILDRRPDGFHNLWSIMQTVALQDEVQIRLRAGRQDIQLRCDATQLAADQSNLVYRAAAEVLARAQQSIGLDIELRKRIPMGAGLGGGSSDAAATIMGLNHLLRLEWSPTQMADAGRLIGSDVPFFLFAPSAFVAGRGETVRPVVVEGMRWVVLVNPGFAVNTKWAYQELAATRTAVTPLALVQRGIDLGAVAGLATALGAVPGAASAHSGARRARMLDVVAPSIANSTPSGERMCSTGVPHSTDTASAKLIALRASTTAASTGTPSASAS